MSISLLQYFLYLKYMLGSVAMLALFGIAYVRITPARELYLIRNGNLACALSFGGALAGFALALFASIANSLSFPDFVLWGLAAAVIQIAVYFTASRLIPQAAAELENNNVAVGAFLCALSLSIGLLNAACLS
ncbi:DUF350 domain-containing protein [Conchiformibius kuhniae]|uniref:DUF350 domain-containing protein n=1 Tax=Conchiformibius kuhniae TaxID=211502 RepID=A0A8T9MW91_9NEIS|nr:DUF350 domain-containing protein [Conchiformibius kuhniae]UOP05519.1 DUF350 domain-containing protein [Conchiformibius kuhniae]